MISMTGEDLNTKKMRHWEVAGERNGFHVARKPHWLRTGRGWDSVPLGNIRLHFSFSLEHVISSEYGSSGGTMRRERERIKDRYLKQCTDLGR